MFEADRRLRVGGETIEAEETSSMSAPARRSRRSKGLQAVPWLSNSGLLDLETLPEHLIARLSRCARKLARIGAHQLGNAHVPRDREVASDAAHGVGRARHAAPCAVVANPRVAFSGAPGRRRASGRRAGPAPGLRPPPRSRGQRFPSGWLRPKPAASVARSSTSPPTRPHIQGVGSSCDRIPMPVAISRTP